MKVIVKIKSLEGEIITGFLDVGVRKCPPNYNTQKGEYVVELEDYTENDIKEYFNEFGERLPNQLLNEHAKVVDALTKK